MEERDRVVTGRHELKPKPAHLIGESGMRGPVQNYLSSTQNAPTQAVDDDPGHGVRSRRAPDGRRLLRCRYRGCEKKCREGRTFRMHGTIIGR